ncbi:MAG: succinate dehydrogenase [Pseudomonadota bacterium]
MRTGLLFAVLLGLSACDTAVGTEVSRASAKGTVNSILGARLPGVPLEPVTDCVIDNASGSEIVQIGSDALRGQPSPETVDLVIEIASRQETITCFIEDAGPILAAQIATAL